MYILSELLKTVATSDMTDRICEGSDFNVLIQYRCLIKGSVLYIVVFYLSGM